MTGLDLTTYQAARESSAFYLIPHSGYLQIGGEDRQAFLQRQTTNDVQLLDVGHTIFTALTTPTARILDVLYLIQEPQTIDAVTMPGFSSLTSRYLRSRIFFMDRVTVTDASAEYIQIDLLGPRWGELPHFLGLAQPPEINQIIRSLFHGAELLFWALDPGFAPGCRILAPAGTAETLIAELITAGAARLGEQEYEVIRVESGAPAAGAEISEEYTPLEAGLSTAVSDRKGCYTGQEVLARQLTYDKVTQYLRGLRLDREVHAGMRLWSEDGHPAGTLTSFAVSPKLGPIGLGIIKRPHDREETRLHLGDSPSSEIVGQVVALPFFPVFL